MTQPQPPPKRIVIVGLGALGSNVALALRNEGVIVGIDHDRVEAKNVRTQFHGRQSVGQLKANALKAMLDMVYKTRFEAVPHKLTKDNIAKLLVGANLVIDTVDNIETRTLIQTFVRSRPNLVACLHGALAANAEFGQAAWDEHFVPDAEPHPGAPTTPAQAPGGTEPPCDDAAQVPRILITAAYVAEAAVHWLRTGEKYSYSVLPRAGVIVRGVVGTQMGPYVKP